MLYRLGKVYKVPTLVVSNGKSRMKKVKVFDLLDEKGVRTVETGIAKKERKFYKQFIKLAEKEGAVL